MNGQQLRSEPLWKSFLWHFAVTVSSIVCGLFLLGCIILVYRVLEYGLR
jgi:hypothetical protein